MALPCNPNPKLADQRGPIEAQTIVKRSLQSARFSALVGHSTNGATKVKNLDGLKKAVSEYIDANLAYTAAQVETEKRRVVACRADDAVRRAIGKAIVSSASAESPTRITA